MAGAGFLRRAHQFCLPPVLRGDIHSGIRTFAAGGAASAKKAKPAKKEKKEVKEEKPKKAAKRASGYLLFVKDTFSKYQSKGWSFAETIKEVAKDWEAAATDTRQKYNDEAARINEMNKEQQTEKRPATAYAEYFRSVYTSITGKYPNASFAEKSQMISKMWKKMDPDEKARRQKIAAEAKMEYIQNRS